MHPKIAICASVEHNIVYLMGNINAFSRIKSESKLLRLLFLVQSGEGVMNYFIFIFLKLG